jgi:polar amino acid transport system substrate-binding protein
MNRPRQPTRILRTRILRKCVAAVLCGSLIVLSLAQAEDSQPGAGLSPNGQSGTLERVLEKGTIRVGVSLFAPWTLRNKAGNLVGFEIDVAKQLAKDLGVQPEFHAFDWENIVPALLKREIDIIAAGMTITPKRALKVNFSEPYHSSGIGMAANIALTKSFRGPHDLNRSDVVLTAVTGTVAEGLARRVFPNATITPFSSSQEAIKAVISGKVHGYVEHVPITTFVALDNPKTVDEPLSKPLLETKAGFAVNKGDPDFVNFLNAWIISHQVDAWLTTANKFWFSSLDWRADIGDTP